MMMETTATTQHRTPDHVKQFSVFMANRMGKLQEIVGALHSQAVHILALTVLETTDSAILRFVVDDPEKTREFLAQHGFPHTETEMAVVELVAATDLHRLMTALLEAELNVNYLYPLLTQPHGKPLLALNMEDNEIGEKVLTQHQFRILKQADLSR
jgi:hypothetical protein